MDNLENIEQLFAHVRGNDARAVQKLIDQGQDLNVRNEYGETALIVAADCGSDAVIEVLLDNKAWIDAADKWGRTALVHSIQAYRLETTQTLLDRGACPWAPEKPKDECCPTLTEAARLGRSWAISLLVKHGVDVGGDQSDPPALHEAAKGGHPHVIKQLIDLGVSVNTIDSNGSTALMEAVRFKKKSCVFDLLDLHASPDIANNNLSTAIHLTKDTDILRTLLNRGARGDLPDPDGNTLLWKAIKATGANFDAKTINSLLDLGLDPTQDPRFRAIYRRVSKVVADGGPESGKLTPSERRYALDAAHRVREALTPLMETRTKRKDLSEISKQTRGGNSRPQRNKPSM